MGTISNALIGAGANTAMGGAPLAGAAAGAAAKPAYNAANDVADAAHSALTKHQHTDYIQDVGAANYGGHPGGDIEARNAAWGQQANNDAAQAQSAGGQSYANGQMYGAQSRGPQAQEDAGLAQNEMNSRYGDQNGAIGLARSLASGQGPSEGAYQLQRGLDQGLAQQTSMGRSARGSAAMATAEGNAGANSANLQQNAFTAGGQLRAQDMAAGRGLYGSMTTQQRAQDQGRLDQGNAMSQGNAARNDQYGLGMGNLANQFGELGNAQDQTDFGYYQQGMAPVNDQFQANQMATEWAAGNRKTAVNRNDQENS